METLASSADPVLSWLRTSPEPAVRLRALLDLEGRPERDPDVQAARAALAEEGWAARLLADLRVPDEPRGLYVPKYVAPFHVLVVLAELGVPAAHPGVAPVVDAVLATYPQPDGGFSGRPGAGKGHLCVTGNLALALLRMGRGDDPRVLAALDWLVARQLPDGGWDCWPDVTGHGTIASWEPLAALAEVPRARRTVQMEDALSRGAEFYLERRLGMDEAYAPWRRFHWPRHYYYDVLLGLDLLTALGHGRDERLAPALRLLQSKRTTDGRWRLDAQHPDLEPARTTRPTRLEWTCRCYRWRWRQRASRAFG